MKIIKPGRDQHGWAEEQECTGAGNGAGGCGAVLLVEEDDVFVTTLCARDEVDYFTTFRCMACGVLTDFAAPSEVMQKARAKHAKAR